MQREKARYISRAKLTTVDGKSLTIESISTVNSAADVHDNNYIKINVFSKLYHAETISYSDIADFLSGDLSVLKEELEYVLAPKYYQPTVIKSEINTYEGYSYDPVVISHENGYFIILHKATDAYEKELKNSQDILDLYEGIADVYEANTSLE